MKKLFASMLMVGSFVYVSAQAQEPQATKTETKKTTKTEHKKTTTTTDNSAPSVQVNVTKRKHTNNGVHRGAAVKQTKTTTTTTTAP